MTMLDSRIFLLHGSHVRIFRRESCEQRSMEPHRTPVWISRLSKLSSRQSRWKSIDSPKRGKPFSSIFLAGNPMEPVQMIHASFHQLSSRNSIPTFVRSNQFPRYSRNGTTWRNNHEKNPGNHPSSIHHIYSRYIVIGEKGASFK